MRRWPPGRSRAIEGCGSRSSSARRSRPAAGTSWRCSSTSRSSRCARSRSTIAEIHDQGGLAIPAHPLVPYPAVRPGVRAPPAPGRAGSALPSRRARDVQPDGARATGPRPLRPVRRRARAGRDRQQRRPCRRGDRHRLDDLPGPRPGRPAPGDPGADDPRARQLPRHGQPGLDVRPPAPQVRPRRPRRGPRPGPPGRHRPRPRLPRRARSTAALRARTRAERGRR